MSHIVCLVSTVFLSTMRPYLCKMATVMEALPASIVCMAHTTIEARVMPAEGVGTGIGGIEV